MTQHISSHIYDRINLREDMADREKLKCAAHLQLWKGPGSVLVDINTDDWNVTISFDAHEDGTPIKGTMKLIERN